MREIFKMEDFYLRIFLVSAKTVGVPLRPLPPLTPSLDMYDYTFFSLRGLPFSTYPPRGRGRGWVKSPIHFHCVLHAKKRGAEGSR